MSEQPYMRNELSGTIGGHAVQAGVIHGDVVIDAVAQARVQHALTLRADRLAVYEEFLESAVQLAKDLQKEASRTANMVARRLATPDLVFTLERDVKRLRAPIDHLSELKAKVLQVGPESVTDAASSVLGASLAVWYSTQLVFGNSGVDWRRWPKDHERMQERLPKQLEAFMQEVRKVREAPPV
ncbi:hypothetical protein [Streptomyces sp. NBC_00649]|uniref:hypothetical protein n=1 Tax=Streptomyces sp. NBC_00649 TaxID=2975798 RepID=UPI00324EC1A6